MIAWPLRPDGTAKRLAEMTPAERAAVEAGYSELRTRMRTFRANVASEARP